MATKKTKKTEPATAEAEAEAPVVEETPAEETPEEEDLVADPPFDPEPLLVDNDDEEDEPVEATEPTPETPAEPAESKEPTAKEPAPTEEPAPAPEPKPTEAKPAELAKPEEQPVAPEPPATPAAETKTPEQLQQEHEEWRKQSEAKLEEFYALDEEDAEAMLTEPGKVLPKLAARLHMEVSTAVAEAVKSLLPSAIQHMTAQQSVAERQEGEFFKAWPKLNTKEHGNTLARLGTTYRAAHPEASAEDFIRDVGATAMVALRIPFDDPPAPAAEPAAPPHVPAAAAGGAAPARPSPTNPFASLVDEFAEAEEVE